MENIKIIDFLKEVKRGEGKWVVGMGKALHKDEILEIWFCNKADGEPKNQNHEHNLSMERFLVINGGVTIQIEGKEIFIGPLQMVSIPPGVKHNLVKFLPETTMLNLRNSPWGAVGHLPEDRK
jgi:mannose-6-phosphate isomerase-like protein (cupin superfamily)